MKVHKDDPIEQGAFADGKISAAGGLQAYDCITTQKQHKSDGQKGIVREYAKRRYDVHDQICIIADGYQCQCIGFLRQNYNGNDGSEQSQNASGPDENGIPAAFVQCDGVQQLGNQKPHHTFQLLDRRADDQMVIRHNGAK